MADVLPFVRPAHDTVSTLRELLQQAEAGHVTGIMFAVRYGANQHEFGATGDYRKYPTTALGAAVRLIDGIKGLIP